MSKYVHRPVMLGEAVAWLRPRSDGTYVDGTLGGGSHAEAILEASSPKGRLWGFDRDGTALEATRERLLRFEGRFQLVHADFAVMAEVVPAGTAAGVLLDLGMSSHQLDTPQRGFGFGAEGPLDMRMDQRERRTARDLVNELSAEELANIFWMNADERNSRRIARAIVDARSRGPIETTGQLADLVERVCPRRGKKSHPATRVFQALRVEVNEEVNSLKRGLAGAWEVMSDGGRLVVITFDSLHDRVTKDFMRRKALNYDVVGEVDRPEFRVDRLPHGRVLTNKAHRPSEGEIEGNPRARSAQMRVIEKGAHGQEPKK